MRKMTEGGFNPTDVQKEIEEGVSDYIESMQKVIPEKDFRSAESLVEEQGEALKEVKEKQKRIFLDEKTQLPKVGGSFGAELRAMVIARRAVDDGVDVGQNRDKSYKHSDNIGKMIAEALDKGKKGYDFRSALPYRIGNIGGVEMVYWPAEGHSDRPFPTTRFKETIEQFLPEDCKWMSRDIVQSVIVHLFPSEEKIAE